MKLTDVNQLTSNFKSGDTVWACNYEYNPESQHDDATTQLPVKGILASSRRKDEHANTLANGSAYINYFIPLRSNGKPNWQKALPAYSLNYATTELECKELYNELIDANIEWHKAEVARLKKERIKMPKSTTP